MSFILELTSIFLADTSKLVPQLGSSLANEDGVNAQKLAHRLKGSCGNIGARRMEEISSQKEKNLKRGESAEGKKPLFGELENEFVKVTQVLTEMVRNPSMIFDTN